MTLKLLFTKNKNWGGKSNGYHLKRFQGKELKSILATVVATIATTVDSYGSRKFRKRGLGSPEIEKAQEEDRFYSEITVYIVNTTRAL